LAQLADNVRFLFHLHATTFQRLERLSNIIHIGVEGRSCGIGRRQQQRNPAAVEGRNAQHFEQMLGAKFVAIKLRRAVNVFNTC